MTGPGTIVKNVWKWHMQRRVVNFILGSGIGFFVAIVVFGITAVPGAPNGVTHAVDYTRIGEEMGLITLWSLVSGIVFHLASARFSHSLAPLFVFLAAAAGSMLAMITIVGGVLLLDFAGELNPLASVVITLLGAVCGIWAWLSVND